MGHGLVGRESALVGLRRAVDNAVGGRGRLELIVGEAGIGKTALAAEVVEYASARGMGVLWATCWDGDGAPAYWPWVQVLRAYQAGRGGQSTLGRGTTDLALIIPELAGPSASAGPSVPGDGARERFGLFDAVASLLVREARSRPLLVVLDDLQWADAPSLLLLNFIARQLVSTPLLVVGSYRDDDARGDETRRELLAQARGNGEVVTLTGLGAADVERLMGSVAGARPNTDLAGDVFRRTGGNPFFVREVTQLLVSRGGLADDAAASGGIPDGVRQVVTQRLARLPQACVSILTVAAVAGRETGSDLLVRVAGGGIDTLAEQLDDAVRARVLVQPSGMAGPYRFAHDLFREVLYDGLSPSTRTELHLRVGRALQESAADGPVHPAALAHHLLLAAVGRPSAPELGEEAARYGALAAEEATARLAYEDAVGHIQRQLDGLSPAGLLREPARLELLLCRAEALRCAGQLASAREDYRQAIDLARATHGPTQLGRAALGVHALGVESGASRAACVELLDEALDQLSDEDSGLKARVLACLARELFLSGVQERTRAAWLSAAAVETARRVGDDAALAVCLLASHDTIWLPGTADRRRAIAIEMGTVARRAGDRAFEAEACLLQATAGLELGDPAAIVDLDEFVRLGLAVGQPRYTYLALTRGVTLATMRGRFAEAERLFAEAGTLAEAIGEPDAWNVQTRQLWELRSAQGRRGEAEAQIRTLQLPQLKHLFDAMLGLVLLDRGERAEAVRTISSAVQTRPEQLAFSYVLMVQWAELGQAAAAAGLQEACRRYYDAMRPYSGTVTVTAAAVGFYGAVDHHLGVLAAALGRPDDAVVHLERAVVMHERLSAWPWLARTQCELAAALAARGFPADGDRVSALLDDVRQAADELGIHGLLRRVDEIRLPPANVFRRDGDGWQISFAGKDIRLRHVKGLGDIAALLRAEGREVPAISLAAGVSTPTVPDFAADPVLDRHAQQQYKARLAELDADIESAQAEHDLGRAGALADERAFLVRELSAAVGLGNRDRRLGDDRERARKAVAGRIKDALNRIDAADPALGAHLSQAISMGTLCAYRPAHATRWRS
jgi:tetratricopeptide (TPR) repeat protein